MDPHHTMSNATVLAELKRLVFEAQDRLDRIEPGEQTYDERQLARMLEGLPEAITNAIHHPGSHFAPGK